MKMKYVDIIFTIIGLAGLITIGLMSIADSQATDIISAVPVQLIFASFFIAGYISYRKNN